MTINARFDTLGDENAILSTETKPIEMFVERRDSKPILRFIGGPTGYESYYLSDLMHECNRITERTDPEFCICAGTAYSWRRCTVQTSDVIRYLLEQGHVGAPLPRINEMLKDRGLPKIKLIDDYEELYEQFRAEYGTDGNCSCHLHSPCGSCMHPGNPANKT